MSSLLFQTYIHTPLKLRYSLDLARRASTSRWRIRTAATVIAVVVVVAVADVSMLRREMNSDDEKVCRRMGENMEMRRQGVSF